MSNPEDWEDMAFLQLTINDQVNKLIPFLADIYAGDTPRADRNYAAEQIVHSRLKPQLPKGWYMFFTADLPDNGSCRFQLRVTRRPEDMHQAEPVFADHDINFMKPHLEWVTPPEQVRRSKHGAH